MSNFAGEDYLITHIGFGFDNRALVEADVTSVTVSVFAPSVDGEDPVKVVDEATMTWDPAYAWKVKLGSSTKCGTGLWKYEWDTTDYDPGTYKYRVTLHGVAGGKSWEEKRFRLQRDPLPA